MAIVRRMNIMNYFLVLINLYIFLIISSCDNDKHIHTYSLPKNQKIVNKLDKKVNDINSLTWNKPSSWKVSSGSSMRLASFDVPYKYGVGDLSVIKLQGDGGGISSNINRWRRQLNLSPISLAYIEKQLTFYKGYIGEYSVIEIYDSSNVNAFICAIIPYNDVTIFVKLSIKSSGNIEVKNDFINFCNTLKI